MPASQDREIRPGWAGPLEQADDRDHAETTMPSRTPNSLRSGERIDTNGDCTRRRAASAGSLEMATDVIAPGVVVVHDTASILNREQPTNAHNAQRPTAGAGRVGDTLSKKTGSPLPLVDGSFHSASH